MLGAFFEMFERYVNFEFYKTLIDKIEQLKMFERYVNFEFYKTQKKELIHKHSLRDM